MRANALWEGRADFGDAVAERLRAQNLEQRAESLASQLASAIRTVASPTLPGWASSLRVVGSFPGGEIIETVKCSLFPVRVTVPSELVRVDLNVPVGVPFGEEIRRLVQIELAPFIIGVGYVRVEDTPEGLVITRSDVRDIKVGHHRSPEIAATSSLPDESFDK